MEPPRCPITTDFMRDPVMATDGQTYERQSIEQWFQSHDTSPYTGAILSSKKLTPNWAIKQMMETYFNPPTTVQTIAPKHVIQLPEILIRQNKLTLDDKKYLNIELICGSSSGIATIRKPVIIIAVIDTSGSMGERATPYNPDGENDGFTRLDLVKHSLSTIQKSLQPGDQLAIIAFSSEAKILLDITEVGSNERLITSRIDLLRPDGMTNIWGALKMACDLANQQDVNYYNTAIMLLTDGVANINPPRGVLQTFESYFKSIQGKFAIHTFAYGYDIDSSLVAEIATMSKGIFGYIPDGTMVGTVFINTMSAILSTVYNDVNIELTYKSPEISASHKQMKIYLGSILYGQPRNILIPYESFGKPEYFNLYYNQSVCRTEPFTSAREVLNPFTDGYIINVIVKDTITNFLQYSSSLSQYSNETVSRLEKIISQFADYSNDDNLFICDVLSDCCDADPNKGQIGKSIEKPEWFYKWGQHYLKSIASAYRQEWCLNFKDMGPQHFTSATFANFREKIEAIFLGITPPTPSIVQKFDGTISNRFASQSTPAYASIPQSYYDQSGGCFTGNWKVNLADGTTKLVSDIVPGDIVISNDSLTGQARITHIIRLRINEPFQMCSPDGKVGITSYHPFWKTTSSLHRDWQFPIQELTENYLYTHIDEYIYDFIIDQGYSVALEGGYNVACLGHGCQDSTVIMHEYFGTQRVIDDLKDHEAWSTGYIILDKCRFTRHSVGLVSKLEW
jgi:Mg-chelatase subunit ChlD